ncbi:MAG: hypothetical protein IH628_01855, partial [Proteobacteria bacterium]|nr:hypothetical protein [Pseudomonadota bacterium]
LDALYVHCQAGKHRSAAVAKYVAERYDLPGGIRVYEAHNRRVYRVLIRCDRRKKGSARRWNLKPKGT